MKLLKVNPIRGDVAIFGDDFEEKDEYPFVIDTLGFGGEFGEEIGEGKSFSGVIVGGEATLGGVSDGGDIRGDRGGEVAGEDTEGVAKFKEVRV
ncbi:hypothetical protein VNO78_31084 [Psophocarpus tetragonolobus]|uniref:Uncharacterized protein n=1 Tax=Psophocarpus tetragonolobus TaxID=3891 RepID=A0AAN9RYM1_PSOTE